MAHCVLSAGAAGPGRMAAHAAGPPHRHAAQQSVPGACLLVCRSQQKGIRCRRGFVSLPLLMRLAVWGRPTRHACYNGQACNEHDSTIPVDRSSASLCCCSVSNTDCSASRVLRRPAAASTASNTGSSPAGSSKGTIGQHCSCLCVGLGLSKTVSMHSSMQ